jgi:hypothetical protein
MCAFGAVRRTRRTSVLGLLIGCLPIAGWLLTVAVAGPAVAAAGERIDSYNVVLDVHRDGSLRISETIAYDFGTNERHGIVRDIPTRIIYDKKHDRVYRLHDVSVTSPTAGTPAEVSRSESNGTTTLRVGDPDKTVHGRHTYVVRYSIDGALNTFPDHVELFWNAIGLQWDVPIRRATARVNTPGSVDQLACYAGPDRSTTPCGAASSSGHEASFAAPGGLAPFSALTVVVGLPRSAVPGAGPILEERWSVKGALTPTPLSAGLALAVLAVGAVAVVWLVGGAGRDRRYIGLTPGVLPAAGQPVVEQRVPFVRREPVAVAFSPPAGLRPGQIGTLLDEQANVIDVTATIIDLAVRGHLRIEELERPHWFSPRDWRLIRLPGAPSDVLLPFEQELMNGLFETGQDVRLSELKKKFAARLASVQTKLYEDVTAAGWFRGRPDKVRGRWSAAGVGLAAAGGVLTWLLGRQLHWAVVGLAVVVVGLLLHRLGRRMPARTPIGSAVLAQAQGFREYIRTAEADQLRFEERSEIFSRYLPYAIVFGEAERWVTVFGVLAAAGAAGVAAGPGWYVGPGGWDPSHFNESLTGFTTSASSTFAAATPSSSGGSGFSGGGSSGGGGGGGGGGSW